MQLKQKFQNKAFILVFILLALSSLQVRANVNLKQEWKVLVYMQADNDLASYALWDIAEMSQGLALNEGARVFVDIDLPGDSGNQRLEVLSDSKPIGQSIENYENIDLEELRILPLLKKKESISQVEKLYDFIKWAQVTYPTQNTMLAIWGHGEGWSYSNLAQFGGVAIDDNPASRLNTKQISHILQKVQKETGEQIDFLSLDACLMQTAEVALEFSQIVPFVSGSTQIQNFRGLPYQKLIKALSVQTPYELAINLSSLYLSELKTYASLSEKQKATISVVNTKELEQLFVYPFNKAMSQLTSLIQQKPLYKMLLANKLKSSPSFLGNSRDLSNFIGILMQFLYQRDEFELYDQFNKSLKALDKSIMSYGYGEYYLSYHGYYLGFFKAFGVWFPANNNDFSNRSRIFEGSTFYKKIPAWGDFLYQLFRPIKPVFPFLGRS